jgi:hypothetical protein
MGAPILCGLDGGPDFAVGELFDVERIVVRSNTAIRHQLDLTRTAHQLFANAAQYLGVTVRDGRKPVPLGEVQGATSLGSAISMTPIGFIDMTRCTWASVRPGIRVRPVPAMTVLKPISPVSIGSADILSMMPLRTERRPFR